MAEGQRLACLSGGVRSAVLGIALGGGEDQETTTVTDQITETVVRTGAPARAPNWAKAGPSRP